MRNEKGREVPDGVAADLVVFTKQDGVLKVVLIERGKYPFGSAVPGGHIEPNETFKQCAIREFEEECNVKIDINNVTLLNEYSEPGMDPRGWYVCVAYMAVVKEELLLNLKAKDDAKKVILCDIDDVLNGKVEFAFKHHKQMVKEAVDKLQ